MASNVRAEVLGPRKVILFWNYPHPIDVFKAGKVTQEVKYRMKSFRNIFQNGPWIMVRLIFNTVMLVEILVICICTNNHTCLVFTEGHIIAFDLILSSLSVFYYLPYQFDPWEETPDQFNRKRFNKTISDLQPYAEYELSLRLHTGTGPIREKMWSEPALVTIRTKSTRK